MKKFKELSDLVEQGLIDETFHRNNSREVIDDKDTQAGRVLIDITEKIAIIDLSRETNYLNGTGDCNLLEVITQIESAENLVEQFLKLDYPNPWYFSKSAEVMTVSKLLDKYLEKKQTTLYQEFVEKNKQLKKRKTNFEACCSLRQDLDKIAGEYFIVYEASEKRGLKIDKNVSKLFLDYGEKRKRIEELEKKISLIYERYLSFHLTTQPLNELREIKRELRNRRFSKGDIVKECVAVEYYEGVMRLKKLEDDIKYVAKNFDHVVKIKESISSDIAKIAKEFAIVEGVHKSSLSVDDLNKLREIKESIDADKYDSYRELIYLENSVSEYKISTNLLRCKVSHLIEQESERLREQYNSIESKSRKVPESITEISDYVSLINGLNNELNSIGLKFEALGDKTASKKALGLLREDKKRLEGLREIEEDYKIVKRLRSEVASLRNNTKQFGVSPERIDDLVRLYEDSKADRRYVPYKVLRENYNSAVDSLRENISSLVNSCINIVDEMYSEAEKDNSYDIRYLQGLYEKINMIRDISSRIEKAKALAEKRKNTERESFRLMAGGSKNNKISSLSVYIQSIDYPPDTNYWSLREALLENRPYIDRLKRFTNILKSMEPAKDYYTLEWIGLLKFGIEQCLRNGQMAMELNSRKADQLIVDEVINTLNQYLKTSEQRLGHFSNVPQ